MKCNLEVHCARTDREGLLISRKRVSAVLPHPVFVRVLIFIFSLTDMLFFYLPDCVQKLKWHLMYGSFLINVVFTCICKKGTANPLQAWTGPEVSRKLRLPDFKKISTLRW